MGRKSDRTKNALADALLAILVDDSNAAVTVKSVSDRAGVDRQTFYYHFSNIEEILSFLSHREASALMVDLPESASFDDGVRSLLEEIERRRCTLRAIANRMGYPLLMRILQDRATELLNARIDWETAKLAVTLNQRQQEKLVRYCSLATASALEEWITGRLEFGKKELADFLIQSFNHQLAGSRSSSD